MRRYKFENLLMAFLINRQQSCLSTIDGKKWDEEVGVENLLIAILISKQRKKLSSQNLPECAFYKKICQSVLFLKNKSQNVNFLFEKSQRHFIFNWFFANFQLWLKVLKNHAIFNWTTSNIQLKHHVLFNRFLAIFQLLTSIFSTITFKTWLFSTNVTLNIQPIFVSFSTILVVIINYPSIHHIMINDLFFLFYATHDLLHTTFASPPAFDAPRQAKNWKMRTMSWKQYLCKGLPGTMEHNF